MPSWRSPYCLRSGLFTYALLLLSLSLRAQTALWSLEHPQSGTRSYLLGTPHDFGLALQMPDYALSERLEEVDVLALEQVSERPGETLLDHALLPGNRKLFQVLRRGQYRRACRFFTRIGGLDQDVMDDYQPAYLAVLAGQYRRREGVFLDWTLRDMALLRDIPVVGLESIREQMTVLEGLSRREQAALLDASVRRRRRPPTDAAQVVSAYLHGQMDSLHQLLGVLPYPAYHPMVIQGRNRLLAERIYSLTEQQSALIAVGAAHLGGPDNLRERLEALGMLLEPVFPEPRFWNPMPADERLSDPAELPGLNPEWPAASQFPEAEVLYPASPE